MIQVTLGSNVQINVILFEMSSSKDTYSPVNTFTRRVQINQIVSYLLVTSLFIIFFASIQNNYRHPTTRLTIIIIFMTDFLVLVLSTLVVSMIDPADPVLLIYRNGDKKEASRYL